MELWCRGTARDIVFGERAQASLSEAEGQVAANDRNGASAQIRARLKLIACTPRVSSHILRHEGEQVYAVKTEAGIRGYGWFDRFDDRPAFIVNHFVFKNWQKLRKSDRDQVIAARDAYRGRSR